MYLYAFKPLIKGKAISLSISNLKFHVHLKCILFCILFLFQGQMPDGKFSIHDAIKGAAVDSDYKVITLEHLNNTDNPHNEQLIQILLKKKKRSWMYVVVSGTTAEAPQWLLWDEWRDG